jgi:hypothetical protein
MLTHWPNRRPNAGTPSSAPATAAAASAGAIPSDAILVAEKRKRPIRIADLVKV